VNVYFHTFGCKANQYDTDRVRQAFDASGATVVDDPALADLAVINSCTVTNESEVKLRRLVRHVAKRGHAQTIVMGCAAALDSGAIAALPSVRAVVANADPEAVLRAAGVGPCSRSRTGATSIAPSARRRSRAATTARGASQSSPKKPDNWASIMRKSS
jgi:tRNA A37 methylthiotransferase MiaB